MGPAYLVSVGHLTRPVSDMATLQAAGMDTGSCLSSVFNTICLKQRQCMGTSGEVSKAIGVCVCEPESSR